MGATKESEITVEESTSWLIPAKELKVGQYGRIGSRTEAEYQGDVVLRTFTRLVNISHSYKAWAELGGILVRPFPPGTKITIITT